MTGPTDALTTHTADTRILARCARGYDWNYVASGETITTGGDVTISSTISTAAAVGGRTKFSMTIDAAMGAYSNALKSLVTYGTAGSTSGLGSSFCAETVLSAGCTAGTYSALEAELVAGSGAVSGSGVSFLFCNGSGADVATIIDAAGYLIEFGAGCTAGSGTFIDTAKTSHTAYGGIRIKIPGVGTKWLAVVSD